MVRLHVKKGDEDLFLYDASYNAPINEIIADVVHIQNGRLKIGRMSAEMENLAQHGIHLPPNMVGLLDEQIQELKLRDEFADTYTPSGGVNNRKDEYFRRNGQAPIGSMAKVLMDTLEAARAAVHRNLTKTGRPLTFDDIKDEYAKLKGAITIVYPMGLPIHEPLHVEMTAISASNLDAGHGGFRDELDEDKTALWWAGKELQPAKILIDYTGRNNKTKITVKIAEKGKGAPGREPIFTEEQKKKMIAQAFRRKQELDKLEDDDDDHYLNSQWADRSTLKKVFHGIRDIQIRPI